MDYILTKLKADLEYQQQVKKVAEEKLKTRGALNQEAVLNYQHSLDEALNRIEQINRVKYLIELDIENPVIAPGHDEEHF